MNYEAAMAHDFNAGRAVSPHAMTAWHSAIAPYMSAATRILDVGSGTGRFAVLLAQWFGAPVFGIEPANAMCKMACAGAVHRKVFYVYERAESIPFLEKSFSAALLSNVCHHISDRVSCAAELARVLHSE